MSGSKLNPTVLLQLAMQYRSASLNGTPRTFVFTKNHRIRVHKETDEEIAKRKSYLNWNKKNLAEVNTRILLKKSLQGKLSNKAVWIHPDMHKIAVPLQMAASENGYGVLPSGSRIDIPAGQFVRAFTYWEKVNDIDLSVFAMSESGNREEFSWRNMWGKQSQEIAFSGDQTSGFNGGSEYFDIDLDEFVVNHPGFRYLIFCDNVYSGIPFSECECRAGFMLRDTDPKKVPLWKGERNESEAALGIRGFNETRDHTSIFDPKTVATSFRITADSTMCYLFTIDLKNREMVWLNLVPNSKARVAATADMDFLIRTLQITDVFSMYDLYAWSADAVVENPEDADILIGDEEIEGELREDQEWIHSWNFEKMLKLLNP